MDKALNNSRYIAGKQIFQPDFPFYIKKYLHRPHQFNSRQRNFRDFWKIIYIIKGSGWKYINTRQYPLVPGNIYFVHPEDQTTFEINPPCIEIYNILFLPILITEYIQRISDDFSFFSIFQKNFHTKTTETQRELLYVLDSNREIETLIKKMEREFLKKDFYFQEILKFQLVELLVLISRRSKKNIVKKTKYNLIEYLNHFVHEHCCESINLNTLSQETGFSKSHICREFHAATGRTLIEFLRERRLSLACDLLRRTNTSVTRICYECGFNDLSYFNRSFQAAFKTSPAKYRKNYGQY
ncbi:MAG: hypothetical protein A2096_03515 [Spirochaetes bacterium GWF1_41_5]|nr:MAG: hypothetical protein A2096_03515 [Spirochaetes bacterium GWF1_41_5]HBE03295.1 hypothetical protein [Spirochaetia bacterium]